MGGLLVFGGEKGAGTRGASAAVRHESWKAPMAESFDGVLSVAKERTFQKNSWSRVTGAFRVYEVFEVFTGPTVYGGVKPDSVSTMIS